jgi:hypothetical protein
MFNIEEECIDWTIDTPCDVLSVDFSPDQKYLASAHVDMTAMVCKLLLLVIFYC